MLPLWIGPTQTADSTPTLVLSLRHGREELVRASGGALKSRVRLKEQGYTLVPAENAWLAIDRDVLASLSNVVAGDLVDYFASRDFSGAKISDLPENVRAALVAKVQEILPGTKAGDILARSVELQPAATVRMEFPAGAGRNRTVYVPAPEEALAGISRPPRRESAAVGADGTIAGTRRDLKMYSIDERGTAATLELWGELQDEFFKTIAAIQSDAAARSEPYARAAKRWLDGRTGTTDEESASFPSLDAETRKLLARAAGTTEDRLADARLVSGAGKLFVNLPISDKGAMQLDLRLLGDRRRNGG